jgi:murein endopeptidase
MSGFQLKPGEHPDPKTDPNYAPNPDFDSFEPIPVTNPPPAEMQPSDLQIVEQSEAPAPLPSRKNQKKKRKSGAVAQDSDFVTETEQAGRTAAPKQQPRVKQTPTEEPQPQVSHPQESEAQEGETPTHVPSQIPAQMPNQTPIHQPVQPIAEPVSPVPPNIAVSGPNSSDLIVSFEEETLDRAIGFYSKGRLANGLHLPEFGEGFMATTGLRSSQYSTSNMQKVIGYTARHMLKEHGKIIKVATLSPKKGGHIAGHVSHQNGLDADILLLRKDIRNPGALSNSTTVSKNFDALLNYELIKILVSTNQIRTIFVSGGVKRALCNYSKSKGLTLDPLQTKIAVETGHPNHMHVRLICPQGSPQCQDQDTLVKASLCPDF